MYTVDMKLLRELLSTCRRHGSKGETECTLKLFERLKPFKARWLMGDSEPVAIVVVIPGSDVLWSCHTDTVDTRDGFKDVIMKESVFSLLDEDTVLGADDAAGIVIMDAMIRNAVPGTYIFHRGEELFGWGSKQVANNYPDWLEKFSAAIAFDRGGYHDVITHQLRTRTCTQTYASWLSNQLNQQGLSYKPTEGIYTDTYEYSKFIPNCTNLSVGYFAAHSPQESLDMNHVNKLLNAVINIFKPRAKLQGRKATYAVVDDLILKDGYTVPTQYATITRSKTRPGYAYANGSSARIIRTDTLGREYIIYRGYVYFLGDTTGNRQ